MEPGTRPALQMHVMKFLHLLKFSYKFGNKLSNSQWENGNIISSTMTEISYKAK